MAEKKNFKFNDILNKSINECRTNYKEIFKLIFFFIGIPLILLTIVQIIFLVTDLNLFSIMSNPELISQIEEGTIKIPFYYTLTENLFSLVIMFLSVLISAAMISTTLKKSKFTYKELVENGKSKYWRFFGLALVSGIFIFLLTLLLIIPGIIFAVYWTFAAYVFFDKKEKIMPSLKQSKSIIKGRWWKTFGYILLFGLIMVAILIVAGIITIPVNLIIAANILQQKQFSLGLLIASYILALIYNLIVSFICVPLSALFFKNFYIEMKNSVSETSEKSSKTIKKEVKKIKKSIRK